MSIVRTEDCSQECFKVDWNQHKKYCKQIAKLGGWRDSEDCAEGVGVIILAEELRIQKLTQKSAEHMVLGFGEKVTFQYKVQQSERDVLGNSKSGVGYFVGLAVGAAQRH